MLLMIDMNGINVINRGDVRSTLPLFTDIKGPRTVLVKRCNNIVNLKYIRVRSLLQVLMSVMTTVAHRPTSVLLA